MVVAIKAERLGSRSQEVRHRSRPLILWSLTFGALAFFDPVELYNLGTSARYWEFVRENVFTSGTHWQSYPPCVPVPSVFEPRLHLGPKLSAPPLSPPS